MSSIRWGILSTANIGVRKVIPAMQRAQSCVISAIASQNLEKAQTIAAQLGIERAYGSYAELLADPEIDAIYNPLPNHLHVDWTLQALAAGKHVLCEKPFSHDSTQLRRVIAAQQACGLVVGEAFMMKAALQWRKVMELLKAGEIGEVHAVQGSFFYRNLEGTNIRNRIDSQGGAMMDIGCYPLMVARMVFGDEPKRVLACMANDPVFGTDRLTSAILEFAHGHCTFSVGTQTAPFQRVFIFGSRKHIEVRIPFNAPTDRVTPLLLHGNDILAEFDQRIEFPHYDQYTLQAENFMAAIRHKHAPLTPLTDSFANAAAIEALFKSSQNGTWQVPHTL